MVCALRLKRESEAEKRNIAMSMLLVLFFLSFFSTSHAIWLTLPSSGTKCVSEEIQNHVVVLADYVVISGGTDYTHTSTISVKVTSPYGKNLHFRENITIGNFAFTSQESGTYLACFWVSHNHGGGDVNVNLDWKTGIAAKDWDSVARKEQIEGVELELRKLEGAVEAIHENLIYLKGREAEMRTVSETTNGRVAWFSIMSLGICIAVSALQLWHLKRYFQKKKLI
ncbi:transmembrane emp24 domain-containing protein p24delta4-like [Gastrolobium bilobum]|uniref:transmembrane emp24 domain-containing protein p24delta4-like n=1 Tax=Gastrolobium bilobum TaxID=150636 RepID=UPI002AB2CFAB|nr:transmembrane emp24 domain-containing protein p24delta4-like [Gastrolobium bilobum]